MTRVPYMLVDEDDGDVWPFCKLLKGGLQG